MEVFCHGFPADGIFQGSVFYDMGEMATPYFLLNREFTINRLICDDAEIPVKSALAKVTDWGYLVRKVSIPPNAQTLRVEYAGRLSGRTGMAPYVRERITPAFTFLRWETISFPPFCPCSGGEIIGALFLRGNSSWRIRVSADYEVVVTEKLTERRTVNGDTEFIYDNARQINDFSCAVAPYQIVRTTVGAFYLLHDCPKTDVAGIMHKAHPYIDAHFGARELSENTISAAIPEGFGNFAIPGTNVVFIQESAFRSLPDMTAVIHEFIHLGWNAKVGGSDQRLRFFDEAFTCYLQMRVMDALTGNGIHWRVFSICTGSRWRAENISLSPFAISESMSTAICPIRWDRCFSVNSAPFWDRRNLTEL